MMRYALRLAARGLGRTWPNPAVGCVIAREGRIVGTGWTQPGGRPHAETMALAQAGNAARGADMWVTLEPCAHQGQTPPCAQAIIEAGIARTAVGCTDPDPRVSGRGIAMLREAGITVEENVLAVETRQLNAGFFRRIQNVRPFIALKLATTLDGKIATKTGESRWITSEAARVRGQWLRSRYDALVTGSGTVAADDPQLTCRLPGLEAAGPVRVVLSRSGMKMKDTQLLHALPHAPLWIVSAADTQPAATARKGLSHFSITPSGEDAEDFRRAMQCLAQQGITRALVEAGPRLNTAALRSGWVERIYWFRAPFFLGDDSRAAVDALEITRLSDPARWQVESTERHDEDRLDILVASETR